MCEVGAVKTSVYYNDKLFTLSRLLLRVTGVFYCEMCYIVIV